MKINNKENDYFNCYKKHTLTHLSLVFSTVLAYIWFTHYNKSLYSIIKIHLYVGLKFHKRHI